MNEFIFLTCPFCNSYVDIGIECFWCSNTDNCILGCVIFQDTIENRQKWNQRIEQNKVVVSMKETVEISKEQIQFTPFLNDGQQKAFDDIKKWINLPQNHDDYKGYILAGYAGTGKTYLTRIIYDYITKTLNSSIICTAPTNKASKVLRDVIPEAEVSTIHSYLCIEYTTEEDISSYKRNEEKFLDKEKPHFVIVDECSMLSKELYSHIASTMLYDDTRFLFIGDPRQLNPVNETISPVWKQHSYSLLKEVMRHDNAILTLATELRSKKSLKDISFKINENGIRSFKREEFNKQIVEAAKSGLFKQSTKIIAWTNKAVDDYNDLVRKVMFSSQYGEDLPYFVPGDSLILTRPYVREEKRFVQFELHTDDEVEVICTQEFIDLNYKLRCYRLGIKYIDRSGKFSENYIEVVHPEDEHLLNTTLKQLANSARETIREKQRQQYDIPFDRVEKIKPREIWKEFWQLHNKYARVKYAMSITSHRSQGSTYENVFIDLSNMFKNSNLKEMRRMLYVGVTRASKNLILKI